MASFYMEEYSGKTKQNLKLYSVKYERKCISAFQNLNIEEKGRQQMESLIEIGNKRCA